jgi:heme-degrading monooxygenase HmoA
MIIRLWRGKTALEKADEYEILMKKLAIPDYSSAEGLQMYFFTRNDHSDYAEFLLITHWESIEAVKRFAGDDYTRAKYYEEDKEFLLDFPEEVEHYEVFASSSNVS